MNISPTQTQVAAVMMSETPELLFPLNRYTTANELKSEILRLSLPGGQANIAEAFKLIRTDLFIGQNGDRSDARNIAVIVTDLKDTIDNDRLVFEAAKTRAAGVEVFAIGLSDSANEGQLRQISSPPQVRVKLVMFL